MEVVDYKMEVQWVDSMVVEVNCWLEAWLED